MRSAPTRERDLVRYRRRSAPPRPRIPTSIARAYTARESIQRRARPHVVHGTPITPRHLLNQLKGESFCVSFVHPQQLRHVLCLQDPDGLLLLDNGAFSHWCRGGGQIDPAAFFRWANATQRQHRAAVAVIPDVIEGNEQHNWRLAVQAVRRHSHFPERLMFCWHMNESLDQLVRAARHFNYVAIASCAQYDVQRYRDNYLKRADEVLGALHWVYLQYGRKPWIHLMRGVAVFAQVYWANSADSANIGRNQSRRRHLTWHVGDMAAQMGAAIKAQRRIPPPVTANLPVPLSRPACSTPDELLDLLSLTHTPRERLFALVCLDPQRRPAASVVLSRGARTHTQLDPDEALQRALEHLAAACVLYEYRPHGSLLPSEQEREWSSEVKQRCELFGIEFLDHFIVGPAGHYALYDHG